MRSCAVYIDQFGRPSTPRCCNNNPRCTRNGYGFRKPGIKRMHHLGWLHVGAEWATARNLRHSTLKRCRIDNSMRHIQNSMQFFWLLLLYNNTSGYNVSGSGICVIVKMRVRMLWCKSCRSRLISFVLKSPILFCAYAGHTHSRSIQTLYPTRKQIYRRKRKTSSYLITAYQHQCVCHGSTQFTILARAYILASYK